MADMAGKLHYIVVLLFTSGCIYEEPAQWQGSFQQPVGTSAQSRQSQQVWNSYATIQTQPVPVQSYGYSRPLQSIATQPVVPASQNDASRLVLSPSYQTYPTPQQQQSEQPEQPVSQPPIVSEDATDNKFHVTRTVDVPPSMHWTQIIFSTKVSPPSDTNWTFVQQITVVSNSLPPISAPLVSAPNYDPSQTTPSTSPDTPSGAGSGH